MVPPDIFTFVLIPRDIWKALHAWRYVWPWLTRRRIRKAARRLRWMCSGVWLRKGTNAPACWSSFTKGRSLSCSACSL